MYLLLTAFLIFIYSVIFFVREDLRKTMIWAGILSIPIFYIKPLTSPQALEDVGSLWSYLVMATVFGFCFGGITAVIFEILFHKKLKVVPHPQRFHLNWLVFGPITFVLFKVVFGLSFASSIGAGFIAQAVTLLIFRKDLLWDALVSGIFLGVVYILFYSFFYNFFPGFSIDLWFSDLSGITLLSIPVEEVVVAFAFGMLWGPLYEGLKGYEVIDE